MAIYNKYDQTIADVFNKKHGFLLIDMSLRDDPAFKYYKNFNRLEIECE